MLNVIRLNVVILSVVASHHPRLLESPMFHLIDEFRVSVLFAKNSIEFGSQLDVVPLVVVVDDVGGKLLQVEQR